MIRKLRVNLIRKLRVNLINSKVHQVNKELSSRFITKFVCNQNITFNNGGLYLNKRGDGALALNFINHIRDWDIKVTVSMNERELFSKRLYQH